MSTPTTSRLGYDLSAPPAELLERWLLALTPTEEEVTQRSGTEAPFCGGLLDRKEKGVYACVVCGLPLFGDEAKFDSGTGWPSFHSAVDASHVKRVEDESHGMSRTEICCARCDAHLGHVFPDGPPPSGERHCLNSASLLFVRQRGTEEPHAEPSGFRRAFFGVGAEEGLALRFLELDGVWDVTIGFQGGTTEDPTPDEVAAGESGHAIVVEVIYDPARCGYRRLLDHFLSIHDPTRGERTPIFGPPDRSAVFFRTSEERLEAHSAIAELGDQPGWEEREIVTQVGAATTFWRLEGLA
ncbi:MAG: peptide-methionine (R)-S-oxide reductase MsrB [Planctomycetota bacterium]|jgi:peptide methionine sulfoxide reductase msrA/msrB